MLRLFLLYKHPIIVRHWEEGPQTMVRNEIHALNKDMRFFFQRPLVGFWSVAPASWTGFMDGPVDGPVDGPSDVDDARCMHWNACSSSLQHKPLVDTHMQTHSCVLSHFGNMVDCKQLPLHLLCPLFAFFGRNALWDHDVHLTSHFPIANIFAMLMFFLLPDVPSQMCHPRCAIKVEVEFHSPIPQTHVETTIHVRLRFHVSIRKDVSLWFVVFARLLAIVSLFDS